MQSFEGDDERGLVYGFVLDGEGGAQRIRRNELTVLDLRPQESLWLHWDRSVPAAQRWLRASGGLGEFACDLLLEEATRPRLVLLGGSACCCSCAGSISIPVLRRKTWWRCASMPMPAR